MTDDEHIEKMSPIKEKAYEVGRKTKQTLKDTPGEIGDTAKKMHERAKNNPYTSGTANAVESGVKNIRDTTRDISSGVNVPKDRDSYIKDRFGEGVAKEINDYVGETGKGHAKKYSDAHGGSSDGYEAPKPRDLEKLAYEGLDASNISDEAKNAYREFYGSGVGMMSTEGAEVANKLVDKYNDIRSGTANKINDTFGTNLTPSEHSHITPQQMETWSKAIGYSAGMGGAGLGSGLLGATDKGFGALIGLTKQMATGSPMNLGAAIAPALIETAGTLEPMRAGIATSLGINMKNGTINPEAAGTLRGAQYYVQQNKINQFYTNNNKWIEDTAKDLGITDADGNPVKAEDIGTALARLGIDDGRPEEERQADYAKLYDFVTGYRQRIQGEAARLSALPKEQRDRTTNAMIEAYSNLDKSLDKTINSAGSEWFRIASIESNRATYERNKLNDMKDDRIRAINDFVLGLPKDSARRVVGDALARTIRSNPNYKDDWIDYENGTFRYDKMDPTALDTVDRALSLLERKKQANNMDTSDIKQERDRLNYLLPPARLARRQKAELYTKRAREAKTQYDSMLRGYKEGLNPEYTLLSVGKTVFQNPDNPWREMMIEGDEFKFVPEAIVMAGLDDKFINKANKQIDALDTVINRIELQSDKLDEGDLETYKKSRDDFKKKIDELRYFRGNPEDLWVSMKARVEESDNPLIKLGFGTFTEKEYAKSLENDSPIMNDDGTVNIYNLNDNQFDRYYKAVASAAYSDSQDEDLMKEYHHLERENARFEEFISQGRTNATKWMLLSKAVGEKPAETKKLVKLSSEWIRNDRKRWEQKHEKEGLSGDDYFRYLETPIENNEEEEKARIRAVIRQNIFKYNYFKMMFDRFDNKYPDTPNSKGSTYNDIFREALEDYRSSVPLTNSEYKRSQESEDPADRYTYRPGFPSDSESDSPEYNLISTLENIAQYLSDEIVEDRKNGLGDNYVVTGKKSKPYELMAQLNKIFGINLTRANNTNIGLDDALRDIVGPTFNPKDGDGEVVKPTQRKKKIEESVRIDAEGLTFSEIYQILEARRMFHGTDSERIAKSMEFVADHMYNVGRIDTPEELFDTIRKTGGDGNPPLPGQKGSTYGADKVAELTRSKPEPVFRQNGTFDPETGRANLLRTYPNVSDFFTGSGDEYTQKYRQSAQKGPKKPKSDTPPVAETPTVADTAPETGDMNGIITIDGEEYDISDILLDLDDDL